LKSGLSSINAFNNKDVKLSDRKFLSSRKLRGFENYGVGPKDGKDHIGGNYSAYSSIASTIPNPLPDKWNANSIIFFDAGNVWGVDYDSSKDSDKIRSSAGLGLDWISPLGPLSFVFAQTLSSADGDLEESFSFQIGSSF
jgi:outer membrane protein insertion porin family